MKKTAFKRNEAPDATLRVSKRTRDRLKAAAAIVGRSLYDVTNEVIEEYLHGINLPALKSLQRRTRGR